MSAQLFTVPFQCVVVSGLAVPGATLTFYDTGTSTKLPIYTTSALTTQQTNPVVANGAGNIPDTYLDDTQTYRLVIKNEAGTVLEDIDPYIPGVTTLGITLTSATGQSVSTLGALAALSSPVNHQVAFLSQSGRSGMFEFDSSNLSAYVTADTGQGIYVAPAAASTGASGAWVRRYSGPMDIRWFGAVANCTAVGVGTDCAGAIRAAAAVGLLLSKSAEILIPKTEFGFRCASTITFTAGVKLKGEGYHANPGQVGATSYTAPSGLRGSMLVFDANTAGLQFIDFTDNAANAIAYEFESSSGSIVSDLRLYGGGGTSTTAHGVEVRTFVDFRNVNIMKFGGNGLYIVANTAGSNPYGNASGAFVQPRSAAEQRLPRRSHFRHRFKHHHVHRLSLCRQRRRGRFRSELCRRQHLYRLSVRDQQRELRGGNRANHEGPGRHRRSFRVGIERLDHLRQRLEHGHVFSATYVEGGNGNKAYLPHSIAPPTVACLRQKAGSSPEPQRPGSALRPALRCSTTRPTEGRSQAAAPATTSTSETRRAQLRYESRQERKTRTCSGSSSSAAPPFSALRAFSRRRASLL
jgi:hypothetical protein